MLSRGGCFLHWTRNFRLYKTGAGARMLHRGSLLTSPGHFVLAQLNNYWTFGSPLFILTDTHPVTSHLVLHCTSRSINQVTYNQIIMAYSMYVVPWLSDCSQTNRINLFWSIWCLWQYLKRYFLASYTMLKWCPLFWSSKNIDLFLWQKDGI